MKFTPNAEYIPPKDSMLIHGKPYTDNPVVMKFPWEKGHIPSHTEIDNYCRSLASPTLLIMMRENLNQEFYNRTTFAELKYNLD